MPVINIYTKENEKDQIKVAHQVAVMCGDREIEGVESVVFDEIKPDDLVMVTIRCAVKIGK